MGSVVDLWRAVTRSAYSWGMGRNGHADRLPRERQPEELRHYAGLWVAVKDGEVVAVSGSSLGLVSEVHNLGDRGRGAVAQYVAPHSDSIVIGVG